MSQEFKIDSVRLTCPVSGFKVSPDTFARLEHLAITNDITMADVVRQSIHFALSNANLADSFGPLPELVKPLKKIKYKAAWENK